MVFPSCRVALSAARPLASLPLPQWLALIVAGSFALALCCAACSALASLDKLGRLKGWW